MAKKAKDAREKIMDHLRADDRNLAWLSEKSGIPYSTLYFILMRKERKLTDKKRKLINETLNTAF